MNYSFPVNVYSEDPRFIRTYTHTTHTINKFKKNEIPVSKLTLSMRLALPPLGRIITI